MKKIFSKALINAYSRNQPYPLRSILQGSSTTSTQKFINLTSTRNIMKLIDIGVNLCDDMFKGIYNGKTAHESDIEQVIQRAIDKHIDKMMITGTCMQDIHEAIELIEKLKDKFPNRLYVTVGVHPTRCSEFTEQNDIQHRNELLEIIRRHKEIVVAVGECGLDYDRLQFCDKEHQKKYFEFQLEIAKKTKLPLFLHNRKSTHDLCEILKRHIDELGLFVVHSFDGSVEELKELLSLGERVYIGINGCSLKTEENLQVVKEIPLDRLCIETDCPYCEIRQSHACWKLLQDSNPFTFEAKKKEKFENGFHVKSRNEPDNLINVLKVIAKIKQISEEDLAEITYNNTMKVYFPHLLEQ